MELIKHFHALEICEIELVILPVTGPISIFAKPIHLNEYAF